MLERSAPIAPRRIVTLCAIVVGLSCAAVQAQVSFTDVTGVHFPDGLANGHYLWGDCDGDGDEDLLVGGKTIYVNTGPPDFVFQRLADTGALASGPPRRHPQLG